MERSQDATVTGREPYHFLGEEILGCRIRLFEERGGGGKNRKRSDPSGPKRRTTSIQTIFKRTMLREVYGTYRFEHRNRSGSKPEKERTHSRGAPTHEQEEE